MSLQSQTNALIGSIAAVKKAHDFSVVQQANKRVERQKLSIRQQSAQAAKMMAEASLYRAKTQRKMLNQQIRESKNASETK